MDATSNLTNDTRYQLLLSWLQSLDCVNDLRLDTLRPASGDASFRRYFRLDSQHGTLIVMDAPPAKEDTAAFVDITHRLAAQDLNVPQILASDVAQGFLLLSDLGQDNFWHALQKGLDNQTIQNLYRGAIQSLVQLQQADSTGLPHYNEARMLEELQVFEEWFINQHCNTTLTEQERKALQTCFAALVNDNVNVAQVFVHRDYHTPNLMMPTDDTLRPGVIDYQDAVLGPITYDLASLVMDARHTWDEEQQLDWAIRYWQAAIHANLPVSRDFAEFHQAYEWMSVQRNLRILGVFCRLSIRDGKDWYLAHLPRLQAYIRQVCSRYEELFPIRKVLDRIEGRQTVLGVTL